MIKILAIYGTRPEAVKMCPLVLELKERKGVDCKVCLTGQHQEMLNEVMSVFGVQPDYNLDIMQNSQTLTNVSTLILCRLESILEIEIVFRCRNWTYAYPSRVKKHGNRMCLCFATRINSKEIWFMPLSL